MLLSLPFPWNEKQNLILITDNQTEITATEVHLMKLNEMLYA